MKTKRTHNRLHQHRFNETNKYTQVLAMGYSVDCRITHIQRMETGNNVTILRKSENIGRCILSDSMCFHNICEVFATRIHIQTHEPSQKCVLIQVT